MFFFIFWKQAIIGLNNWFSVWSKVCLWFADFSWFRISAVLWYYPMFKLCFSVFKIRFNKYFLCFHVKFSLTRFTILSLLFFYLITHCFYWLLTLSIFRNWSFLTYLKVISWGFISLPYTPISFYLSYSYPTYWIDFSPLVPYTWPAPPSSFGSAPSSSLSNSKVNYSLPWYPWTIFLYW